MGEISLAELAGAKNKEMGVENPVVAAENTAVSFTPEERKRLMKLNHLLISLTPRARYSTVSVPRGNLRSTRIRF